MATTRHLYLLRHAKSSWDDAGLPDRERPLAPRGKRALTPIADHLRRQGIRPELVLCSPAERARATLEGVRAALGGGDVRFEEALYTFDATALVERIREVPASVRSLMVVGHNPAMQELATMLASEGPDLDRLRGKFPTGALATLDVTSSWRGLEEGAARLTGFVAPRDLAEG